MFPSDCCCGIDRSSRTEQSVVEVDVHVRFAAMSGHSFSPLLDLHVPLISSSSLTILLTARFTFLQTSLVVGSAIIGPTLSLFGATLSLMWFYTKSELEFATSLGTWTCFFFEDLQFCNPQQSDLILQVKWAIHHETMMPNCRLHRKMTASTVLFFSMLCAVEAFSPIPVRGSVPSTLAAATRSSATASTIDDLKTQIIKSIEPTRRGLSTTKEQRSTIEAEIRALEAACPLDEPARDGKMAGAWEVLYTTAPPPSNGKLGPFVGVAKQAIDLVGGGYKNILQVGSADNVWLSAVLDASWEEWNGELLEEKGGGETWRAAVVDANEVASGGEQGGNAPPSSPWENLTNMLGGNKSDGNKMIDYGATSWKVDFETITISLFGIPLLKNTFPENTARVWKMTCKCLPPRYMLSCSL